MKKIVSIKSLSLTYINNIFRKKDKRLELITMADKPIINKITYLIITASGGSGLIQAARAEKQQILSAKPEAKVITKDLMIDWLGRFFGYFGVNTWNKAQKKGWLIIQEIFGRGQKFAELLFWPHVFFHTLLTLFKEDIDEVIDTQVIGLPAIMKAIRIYNKIARKNVTVKRIIVDLPTKKSTHCFANMRRLSKKDKDLLTVSTIEPLLEKDQTEDIFWDKYCKISKDQVCVTNYPIRKSFDQYINKKRDDKPFNIAINVKNDHEKEIIKKTFEKGTIKAKSIDSGFDFVIAKDDFLITVLLGSQPAYKGTLNYTKSLIKAINEKNVQKNVFLFVFCASEKDGIIQKIYNFIESNSMYPGNLTVVPMNFQQEEVIARLFFRSNLTITRSGGQTAVELMRVSKAKIYVHSECKFKKNQRPTLKKLYRGIPVWEAGNARYLKEKFGAKIVNPELFYEFVKDEF